MSSERRTPWSWPGATSHGHEGVTADHRRQGVMRAPFTAACFSWFEIADEANELAQALDIEGVEVDVDLVAAAGGPGRPFPESLDESPLVVVACGHTCSVKSWATSCSPGAVR